VAETVRTALTIAYLGGGFAGWQVQPDARTVQGELQRALERLAGRPVRLTGAGRTDAGVHAAAQVAHADLPASIPLPGLRAALNGMLPLDVRVLRARRVAPDFHASRWAVAKRYRYRLAAGAALEPWEALRTWLLPYRLDAAMMAAAAGSLAGTHDFAAFALSGHSGTGRRGCVRTVHRVELRRRGRRLAITVEGDGFLRGMVRRIAGALVEVGRGARPASWVADLLADPATRPPAPTAPPHGLTLEKVFYGRREAKGERRE
jgi:tRNA pseudouridine38-40 synthase